RRENSFLLNDAIERRVHLFLFADVFDHRFDHNVAIGKILYAGRALDTRADRLRRFLDRSFFGKLRQRLLDPGKAFVEKLLLNFKHSDVESGGRAHLRNAGTHETTTQNTDFLNPHLLSLSTTNYTKYHEGNPSPRSSSWTFVPFVVNSSSPQSSRFPARRQCTPLPGRTFSFCDAVRTAA